MHRRQFLNTIEELNHKEEEIILKAYEMLQTRRKQLMLCSKGGNKLNQQGKWFKY